jgi:hypothetical protein
MRKVVWDQRIGEYRTRFSITTGEDGISTFLLDAQSRVQLQDAVPSAQTGSSASLLSSPPVGDDTKTFVAAIDSVRQDAEPTAADNLKTLIQDCGVAPHKITELVQELPPRRLADVLIDFYFTSM